MSQTGSKFWWRKLAIAGVSLLAVGCPVGPNVIDNSTPLSATITHQYVPVGCNQTWTVPATGGKIPYSFSIVSGPGTIDPTTGVYTSSSLSSSPTVIEIRDAVGNTTTVQADNVWTSDGAVNAIAQDASNNLYIGGAFSWVCLFPGAYGAVLDSTYGDPNYTMDLYHGGGFNGPVYAWVALGDGTVIAGGDFTSYDGNTANYIVKIDANGAMDTTFDPGGTGFNGPVQTLAIDTIGQIYAGGSFTQYNGSTATRIAKLDPKAGTLNTVFDAGGAGFNGTVESIVFDQYTSLIYAGGAFTQYEGNSVGRIAALDQSNGLLIVNFNPSGTGFNGTVYSVGVDKDGGLYAGGNFTQYDTSSPVNYIAKLDASTGTLNSGFDSGGSGFNGIVYAVDVDPTGIFVGGSFSQYEGSAANNIAMLTPITGTLSTTFDAGGAGFNGTVMSISSVGDGNIYVAGPFTAYAGSAAYSIAKLSTSSGAFDSTFGTTAPPNSTVQTIYEDTKTNIYVGGNFAGFGGVEQKHVAKFNSTRGLDTTFNPAQGGFDGNVNALAADNSGNIYVGGAFANYNASAASNIAKLNTTSGALDATFDAGGAGFDGRVNTLALDGAGNIFVGGAFTTYQAGAANDIAKMDTTNGTLNTTFDAGGAGFNGAVNTLALDGGGNIFVGGAFTTYKAGSANDIAKMDTTNGTLNATFDASGTGFNGAVKAAAIDTGGNIYIGGAFTAYRAGTANHIAKMDTTNGTLDATFDPSGTGFTGTTVNNIVLDGAGNLYAGGSFTAYRSGTAWSVAKMDTTNGTLNTMFDAGGSGFASGLSSGIVTTLLLNGAGYLYVGGTFSDYQGGFTQNFALIGD